MIEQDHRIAEIAGSAIVEAVESLEASNAVDGRAFVEEGRDIKLEADLILNRELTDRLSDTTDIQCMSEEDIGDPCIQNEESFWIVDPLDGSMNFSRKLPLYCVSVALWRGGSPVIGIIYDIERKTMYRASDGKATADNAAIRIGQIEKPESAMLATGFPVLADFSRKSLHLFTSFSRRFKKVRMLGSAALSLAWVSEGRLDAYFERDIMLWDVAAGLAIVEAAGGEYMMLPGRHPYSFDVLAGNCQLVATMRDEVKKFL
jgi:myo-inositol-1(or 4)-monophosphatase